MEKLEQKLKELQEVLHKALAIQPIAQIKPLKIGAAMSPKTLGKPSGAPVSKKNIVNQANQVAEPAAKKIAVKQAKEAVKVDKNGQWSL